MSRIASGADTVSAGVRHSRIELHAEAAHVVAGCSLTVVLLNASGDRCDALALLPGMDDEVMYIPLENFSRERALALHGMLRDCLSTSSIRTQHDRIGRTVRPSGRDDPFISLLAELWTCVIEPLLGCLSLLVSPPQFFLI